MKLINFLFIGFLIYTTPVELSKTVVKKMDKTIHKTWDADELSYRKLSIPANQLEVLDFSIRDNQLYIVQNETKVIGYVFLDQDKGRYDYFDYMLLIDTALVVKKVQVLIYRSDHGEAISNKRWLKQFEGANPQSDFSYGKDIDAISGATLSGNSITKGISRILKQMFQLQQKGLLNQE